MYLMLVADPEIYLSPPARLDRTVQSFSESQCWNFFECRKSDLTRLIRELKFPKTCLFDNRIKMSGEEMFLRGLYELVSGEDQNSIAEKVFSLHNLVHSNSLSTIFTIHFLTF